MAVTTSTTLEELVKTEVINPVILNYARNATPSAQYMFWQDLRGQAGKVGSFGQWVLDTHVDAGETTNVTEETLETTQTAVTAAEVVVRRDLTYATIEETIIGVGLFDFVTRDAGLLLGLALEDDICALYPSLATSVGTSGSNLTIANMVEAQAQVRINGKFGNMAIILDDQQALDYQSAQAAATSTTINGWMVANTQAGSAYLGTFMNSEVWQTGLCDTANTGANVVGACFIRGDTDPADACFGAVMTRDVQTRMRDDVEGRSYILVTSAKWGVAEVADLSGAKIVTDA